MRAQRWALIFGMAFLPLAAGSCELAETARDRITDEEPAADTVATGGGLMLGLQMPGALRPGSEGVVRVSLTNRGDTTVHNVALDLLVPGWVEPVAPRLGDRPVTMAAVEGGTSFVYRMDDPPLEPGQTQTVQQRMRLPQQRPVSDSEPLTRSIRARVVGPNGQALVQVESELTLAGTAAGDTAAGDAAESARVGPLQLGMSRAEVVQAAAGARDTSWSQEGMQERGLVVPVEDGGGRAVALLSGDTVVRVIVRDSLPRLPDGLGVGSTLEDLRAAYGEACLTAEAGEVVGWFPAAPGISFAFDADVPANPAQVRNDPESVPGSARVTRWWMRRGVDDCP